MHWPAAMRRRWVLRHLADPAFRFMIEPPPEGEWVSVDCETTGLDTRRDRIIAVGAVRIVGNRLLTSERLDLLVRTDRELPAASVRVHQLRGSDIAQGLAPQDAMRRLLRFVGSRPLVGYFLEFDVAMINREVQPMLGVRLPHRKIEVSAMYYDHKNRQLPAHLRNGDIDLRFETMMKDLDLPMRPAHNAIDDAVMAGLAFVKLRNLLAGAAVTPTPLPPLRS
jgi:DNA polymerase-3 subunit epsilon